MSVCYSVVLLWLQGGTGNSELRRAWLQLEAHEQELDRLESKMMTGAKLLASKDSRLCQLEFSLLDNTAVCLAKYSSFCCVTYFAVVSLHMYVICIGTCLLVQVMCIKTNSNIFKILDIFKTLWTVLSDLLRQIQAAFFNCILDLFHWFTNMDEWM